MTPAERAGQVLMVGVPAGNPSSGTRLVSGQSLGGVFLAGRTTLGVSSLAVHSRALQRAAAASSGVALFIAVDQEGGQVATLKSKTVPALPAARVQGTWGHSTLSARVAAMAKSLHTAGITMTLAPVADTVAVSERSKNAAIGKPRRDFGANPNAVAEDVSTVVKAVQGAKVSTAVKHFPGLGRVRANTDRSTSASDARATTTDPNLLPFKAGIAAGSRAVMISSARYPGLDPRRPAPFSYDIVTKLLRNQLGYTGIAISDDLGAAKALSKYPVGARAVGFIGAGGDIVLTVRGKDASVMRSALMKQAAGSPVFARRLDQAVTRVLVGKINAGLISCGS